MMKRLLAALFVALSILSCGTLQNAERNMSTTNRSGGYKFGSTKSRNSRTARNSNRSGGYELGNSKRIIGKVFQTIDSHHALVNVKSLDYKVFNYVDRPLVYVVTPSSCNEYLFDDLDINGHYIFIGTHQYKTVNRNYDQFKTVPVFIEKQYYVNGMEWNDWYERIDTPVVSEI